MTLFGISRRRKKNKKSDLFKNCTTGFRIIHFLTLVSDKGASTVLPMLHMDEKEILVIKRGEIYLKSSSWCTIKVFLLLEPNLTYTCHTYPHRRGSNRANAVIEGIENRQYVV